MRRLIVDNPETRIVYGNAVADFIGIVYLVTNTITNEVYIGQTINGLVERWRNHCVSETSALFSPISQYGSANFTISILDICFSFDALNDSEIKYIKQYKQTHAMYNILEGGHNAPKPEFLRQQLSTVKSGKIYTLNPKPMKTLRKTGSLTGIDKEKPVIGTHLDTGIELELRSMSCDPRFDPRLISACCRGKRRSHRRYAWSYKNA